VEITARPGPRQAGRDSNVNSNLTMIVILVSVIHVAVMVVMIWIRVRPTDGDGTGTASTQIATCTVCGEPATGVGYDGLDPDERHDPHTGHAWSADTAHYRPMCAAHSRPVYVAR
jgi:hypothetical protein